MIKQPHYFLDKSLNKPIKDHVLYQNIISAMHFYAEHYRVMMNEAEKNIDKDTPFLPSDIEYFDLLEELHVLRESNMRTLVRDFKKIPRVIEISNRLNELNLEE